MTKPSGEDRHLLRISDPAVPVTPDAAPYLQDIWQCTALEHTAPHPHTYEELTADDPARCRRDPADPIHL